MPTAAPAVLQGPPQPTEADAVAGMTAAGTSHDVRQAAIDKESDAALDPMRKDILAANTDFQTAAAKPAERAPLPQNTAKHLDPKTLNDTASIFMTLGALAGLMTRQPLSAALGNMTAAMKGVQAGDAEQYDRAMSEFKVNFDHAMKTNDAAMKEREAILSDKKMSLTAKMDAFKLVSAKYGEQTLRNQRSFMDQMKVYEGMLKATKETHAAGMQMLRLQEKIDEFRAREARLGGGGGGATGSNLQAEGAMLATGMPLNQVVPGGRYSFAHQNEVKAEAIRQIKESTGLNDQQAGAEYANRQSSYAASKQSTSQLTKMLGATRQAVDQLDFNVKKAKEEMGKLGSTDLSPIINAIARGEEKWTGNPAYLSLFFYMSAVGMESARLLSGGQASIAQLHQGAQEEARKWANINMTPASFDSVAQAMQAEGAERVKTFERAIEKQRVGGDAPTPAAGWTPEKENRLQALHEWRAKALQELRAKALQELRAKHGTQ